MKIDTINKKKIKKAKEELEKMWSNLKADNVRNHHYETFIQHTIENIEHLLFGYDDNIIR